MSLLQNPKKIVRLSFPHPEQLMRLRSFSPQISYAICQDDVMMHDLLIHSSLEGKKADQFTQVRHKTTDTNTMINSVSMESSLAAMATSSRASAVQSEISMAVMKQAQDQQEVFAQALLEMIKQTPTPNGTGQIINIGA
jgi:hypothetical protein